MSASFWQSVVEHGFDKTLPIMLRAVALMSAGYFQVGSAGVYFIVLELASIMAGVVAEFSSEEAADAQVAVGLQRIWSRNPSFVSAFIDNAALVSLVPHLVSALYIGILHLRGKTGSFVLLEALWGMAFVPHLVNLLKTGTLASMGLSWVNIGVISQVTYALYTLATLTLFMTVGVPGVFSIGIVGYVLGTIHDLHM